MISFGVFLASFGRKISHHVMNASCRLGMGGVMFREYCFGEENSLSLTQFYGKLGEFCEKLGEFALAHK